MQGFSAETIFEIQLQMWVLKSKANNWYLNNSWHGQFILKGNNFTTLQEKQSLKEEKCIWAMLWLREPKGQSPESSSQKAIWIEPIWSTRKLFTGVGEESRNFLDQLFYFSSAMVHVSTLNKKKMFQIWKILLCHFIIWNTLD